MMWLPSPGNESAQTHECLAHLPWSITDKDTVKLTYTGVPFSVFIMVFESFERTLAKVAFQRRGSQTRSSDRCPCS